MFCQPINPHWPPPYKHVIFLVCFSQTYFLIKGGQSLIFIQVCPQKPIFQVSVPHFTTCILRFSPLKKRKEKVELFLSSSHAFFLFFFRFTFPLICHRNCKEVNPSSSEILEDIVRNVCPSWHYNTLYQLTRGVGREQGGREKDVKMLGAVRSRGEKRELFVVAYLTGYEATQWLWHLTK